MNKEKIVDAEVLPCAACGYVSKEECRLHMDKVESDIDKHEERLNKNDVEYGKMTAEMTWVKWLLSGIFGVLLVSLIGNLLQWLG